ncbi:hypothetical protein EXU85_00525 [Spirosoma sp. KCTC 42546]|uniref:hypothetical protein n=1 Tax=Spirosoma sp. KCTC 42546 TaxID=2520506 RepID=UPI00115BA68D|nr:hypothetical protein [Spirosoma sp. KCTC 42546]QDK77158.1 hypothetical protein EXU85_00525 [Spirosoma sp. KCTC 42546]
MKNYLNKIFVFGANQNDEFSMNSAFKSYSVQLCYFKTNISSINYLFKNFISNYKSPFSMIVLNAEDNNHEEIYEKLKKFKFTENIPIIAYGLENSTEQLKNLYYIGVEQIIIKDDFFYEKLPTLYDAYYSMNEKYTAHNIQMFIDNELTSPFPIVLHLN